MRKIIPGLLLILFIASFVMVVTPSSVSAASYRTVKFKLTRSSGVSWAKLYINGNYKGHVRKRSFRRIRLRTNRIYRIVAKRSNDRGYFQRSKTFRLSRISILPKSVFLHVARKSSRYDGDSDDSYSDGGRDSVPEGRFRYRTVKFKLTRSSRVSWAKLYINGSYKGHVRKNGYKRIRLRAGKTYKVVAKRRRGRANFYRKKSVYLSRNRVSTKTVILHVSRRSGYSEDTDSDLDDGGRYRRVRCKLTSSSKVAWAKLYVNGSYKGKIYRDRGKIIRLRSGRSYRFKVRRTYRGRGYYRAKRSFIGSGSGVKILYFHPSAR